MRLANYSINMATASNNPSGVSPVGNDLQRHSGSPLITFGETDIKIHAVSGRNGKRKKAMSASKGKIHGVIIRMTSQ